MESTASDGKAAQSKDPPGLNPLFLPIPPAPAQSYYITSSAQKRLFIVNQFEGIGIGYNITLFMLIQGKLDVKQLETACNRLIERHEILRTSFGVVQGEVVQFIREKVDFQISYYELAADDETEAKRICESLIQPFDLNQAPLLRVGVVKLGDLKHFFLFDIHHIIADGTSIGILITELYGLYRGQNLPELKIQYKDFAVWQNGLFRNEMLKEQENYWRNLFADGVPLLNMPFDFKRKDVPTFAGQMVTLLISPELTDPIMSYVKKQRITLNVLFFAVYFLLLSKYCNQSDLVVGTIVSGRRHPDLLSSIGMFVNTLPVRLKIRHNDSFLVFLRDTVTQVLKAYKNQDYPYEKIIEMVPANEDRSRNPLFDTMFSFGSLNVMDLDWESEGLTFTHYQAEMSNTKFDLTFTATKNPGSQIICTIEYNSDLYKKDTVEQMMEHFHNILSFVMKNPESQLAEIEMLSPVLKRRILMDFNDTRAEYLKDTTIQQLFEAQVERTPDQIALIFENQQLTYRELNQRSNQLARVLRKKGIMPDDIVAIIAGRSLEMIVGIMAIFKAGGAYLPIDPDYPQDRMNYMLINANPKKLLIVGQITGTLNYPGEVIFFDNEIFNDNDGSNLVPINGPGDLAYIIYTSGSTGKPKGVMIAHSGISNTIQWRRNEYGFDRTDTILQLFSYAFDGFLTSLFTPLTSGATVIIPSKIEAMDAGAIKNYILRYKITHFIIIPSLYSVILPQMTAEDLSSVKIITLAGEKAAPQLIQESLAKNPGLELANEYGPTENSIATTILRKMDPSGNGVIGKPVSNTRVYILNADGKPQPIGLPGELCISGAGLARGYLNDPERTAEKFIPNPFYNLQLPMNHEQFDKNNSQLMYRTGDLVRWLPDGNIQFLGRIDHQVKIRGYRIEPGEIEARLFAHEAVKDAVVVARQYENGTQYLCAYLTSHRDFTVQELRAYLAGTLPEYMIPSYFVPLEQIPLTLSGKVDLKRLPEPEPGLNNEVAYVAPQNETETGLALMWQDILGIERAGIHDNFFDSGGHSLKAIVLVSRIHQVFNIEIPLQEVFTHSTIKGLAEYITKAEASNYAAIESAAEREYYILSPAQKRMYILNQLEQAGIEYNLPGALTITGRLDRPRLEKVFQQLIERHQSLRTSFEVINGEPFQRIHRVVNFTLEYRETGEKEVAAAIHQFIRPFDLKEAPLLRAALIGTGADQHILIYDMHHIISDGISMGILVREFVQLYNRETLPELRIQYIDYSEWLNQRFNTEAFKQQETYWLSTFTGEIPVLNLPADYPRPATQNFAGARFGIEVNEALTKKLKDLATETGTTMYMALLSVYTVLLSKYTGQEDIVVGSPIAGRRHADLEKIIGMFVNTLAMRNYPQGHKEFSEYLCEVKLNALAAYQNQDYQFETLVEQLNLRRDLSRNPLFDTMLVLQNIDPSDFEITGLNFAPYHFSNEVSKFDLILWAVEGRETIQLDFEYCTQLFTKETMTRFAGHFLNILTQITSNPHQGLAEIELLSEVERRQLSYEFNETHTAYPKDRTIQALVEEQAARTPERIALVFENKQLTYGELNAKANSLASFLREKGVTPDNIVGIMVKRSLEMIIGLLGILKAGGAYLPIDPDYPAERINYMLRDSRAAILLTQNGYSGPGDDTGITMIDTNAPQLYQRNCSNLEINNRSHHLACVIYTSGSTGKPKGVMIEHCSVHNLIVAISARIDFNANKTILAVTTISFDIFGLETWLPLSKGLKIVVANEKQQIDPALLSELIEVNHIDIVQMTPSRLQLFLNTKRGFAPLRNVTELILGGEAFPEHLKAELNRLKSTRVFNGYGPTETTIYSTLKEIKGAEKTTIGKPLANTKIYILDKNNHQTPLGVAGELFIAGDGLARGYLNAPELTAEKFVPNPFSNEQLTMNSEQLAGNCKDNFQLSTLNYKLYKTGDLGRWLPDGNIEFLGRVDHQVKIRGYRIEPGEIESRLLNSESIKEAVVIDKKDTAGNQYLCAYLVADRVFTVLELREFLGRELPDYMIPGYFIQMEKLPLTPNGKIHRSALPEPGEFGHCGIEYEAPRNDIEKKLAGIWEEIFEMKNVSIHHNFFDLGGHSLKAIRMISEINTELNIELKLSEIFNHPTINLISQVINTMVSQPMKSIEPLPKMDYYDVSNEIKGLMLLEKYQTGQRADNMCIIVKLTAFNEEIIRKTMLEMLARHEILRSNFVFIDGAVKQKINTVESVDFKIEFTDYDIDRNHSYIEDIRNINAQKITLEKCPLFLARICRMPDNSYYLVLIIHHIIFDGWSKNIFIDEFEKLYETNLTKREAQLPPIHVQYKDFVHWQKQLLEDQVSDGLKNHWAKTFNDMHVTRTLTSFLSHNPEVRRRTFSYQKDLGYELKKYINPNLSKAEIQAFFGVKESVAPKNSGAGFGCKITLPVLEKLKELGKQSNISLFNILIACFNIAIYKITGLKDNVVAFLIALRDREDEKYILGNLLNTILVRNKVDENVTMIDFTKIVNRNLNEALDHKEYPIQQLLFDFDISMNIAPIQFNLHPPSDNYIKAEEFLPLHVTEKGAPWYDMYCSLIEYVNGMNIHCHYDSTLFTPEAIEYLFLTYQSIIEMVADDSSKKITEVEVEVSNQLLFVMDDSGGSEKMKNQ